MKFCRIAKDGGPKSRVTGYWLVEIKSLFSIVLLRFDNGTRDAYHSHAFSAVSWVLRGKLREYLYRKGCVAVYTPSYGAIVTGRSRFHKVESVGTTWVLSLRGPWADHWKESADGRQFILTHGRKEVA